MGGEREEGQVRRCYWWRNGCTLQEAGRGEIMVSAKWKRPESGRLCLLPGRSIVPVDYQKNGCRVRDDDRGGERGMKAYGREVASAPTGGGETGGGVRGGVVAGGLAAVDVLAGGESDMATGGVFVEPEPPVAHLGAENGRWAIGRRQEAGEMNGLFQIRLAGETLTVGWRERVGLARRGQRTARGNGHPPISTRTTSG